MDSDTITTPHTLLSALRARRLRLDAVRLQEAFGPGGAALAAAPEALVVAWRGHLLDLSGFVTIHPGGASALRQMRGRDVSELFQQMGHSDAACATAAACVCGDLVQGNTPASADAVQRLPVEQAVADNGGRPASSARGFNAGAFIGVGDPVNGGEGQPLEAGVAAAMPADADWLGRVVGDRNGVVEVMTAKLRARNATGDTRGYGSRWHDDRRRRIREAHPVQVSQLLAEHQHFPLTLVLGICAALFHFHVAACWIPDACATIFHPVTASSKMPSRGVVVALLYYVSPISFITSSAATSSGEWPRWVAVATIVFIYAFVIGAVCKMVAFGTGHELCHETVHPWVSMGLQPLGTALRQCSSRAERCACVARFLCKDLALRLCTLPSVDHTIFEYYANQHLAHHRYLGSQDVSDALSGLVNGSCTGDGDQLAVIGIKMHQRNTATWTQRLDFEVDEVEDGGLPPPLKAEPTRVVLHHDFSDDEEAGIEKVVTALAARDRRRAEATQRERVREALRQGAHLPRAVPSPPRAVTVFVRRVQSFYGGANLDSLTSGLESAQRSFCLFQWLTAHPTASKLLLDPPLHLAHWLLANSTAMVHVLALLAAVGFAIGGWALPASLHCALCRAGVLRVSQGSMRAAAAALWPLASVGAQCAVKVTVLWRIHALTTAAVAAWPVTEHAMVAQLPIGPSSVFCFSVLYLILSELFCFGFLFHPFMAYFLTVHHSAYDRATPGKDSAQDNPTAAPMRRSDPTRVATLRGSADGRDSVVGLCQPTRSMYGSPLFSLLTMNLTHHVEHHDFPSVPWFYLPTITAIAPEFYKVGSTTTSRAGGSAGGSGESPPVVVGLQDDADSPGGGRTRTRRGTSAATGSIRNGIFAVNATPLRTILDYLMHEPRHTIYGCANCT